MTEAKKTAEPAKHENIAEALAAAQAEFPPIPKGRTGKISGKTKGGDSYSYEYHYAALEDIVSAVRPVLAAHGLSFTQNIVAGAGEAGCKTTLHHASGCVESDLLLLPAGDTAQTAGSAITYARRYSLSGLLGIATEEDDDAAGATDSEKSKSESAPAALATENQRHAVWAKAKALGMTDKQLAASIRRDYPKKTHPDELTKAEASALMDKMQAAIDAKAEPKPADVPLSEGDAGGYWPPEDEIGAESADEVGAE